MASSKHALLPERSAALETALNRALGQWRDKPQSQPSPLVSQALEAWLSLVSYVASQNGRSGFGWMLMALISTPLLALIALAAMPEAEPPPPLNPLDTGR